MDTQQSIRKRLTADFIFLAVTPLILLAGLFAWESFILKEPFSRNLLFSIVFLYLAFLGVSITFALRTIRRIVNPIEALAKTAKAVESGDFNSKAQVHGADEVAVLAKAFNAMTSRLIDDLEQHRRTEEELRQARQQLESKVDDQSGQLAISKKRMEAILQNSSEGFWMVDQEGKTTEVNLAMARMLGLEKEEMMERQVHEFLAPDSQESYHRWLDSPAESQSRSIEAHLLRADGREIATLVNAAPLLDDTGERIGAFAMITEISDLKKSEQEMAKARNIESLGILAGGIAHDFNNMLTAVFGNIELAKLDMPPDNPAYELLEAAAGASKRAQHLTRQLLTFSRGGDPVRQTASIAELLNDTINFALSGSPIKFELETPRDLWPVNIDKSQIGQVFQNLVFNAKEAMPEGGALQVHLTNITLDRSSRKLALDAGKYVQVILSDSGPGIDKEIIHKIFDPYFSTKKMGVKKGQGLGLAICHSIIIKHGGAIQADSAPGRGTTFTVYLPVLEEDVLSLQEITPQGGLAAGESMKILILEDEEEVRLVTGNMLNYLGFVPLFAEHGEKAIAMYEEAAKAGEPFDAVILDLTIRGGLGGKATMERLLQINPAIKALVASGYADDPVMSDFRSYGFKAALEKPFSAKALNLALKEILS